MRKAKVLLGLNLAKDIKDSKKSFFKYINNKKKTKENMGPLLNGAAILVIEDTEKAKVVNSFFSLVAADKDSPQEAQ